MLQIINSYYSNLVNIVYSFGGDIIKIAGDALYCVFVPDENDLRGAVLCAALCSVQLREVGEGGLLHWKARSSANAIGVAHVCKKLTAEVRTTKNQKCDTRLFSSPLLTKKSRCRRLGIRLFVRTTIVQ